MFFVVILQIEIILPLTQLYCCVYSNGVAELQGGTKHNEMSYSKTEVPVLAKYVVQ